MLDIILILLSDVIAMILLGAAFARIEKNEDLSTKKAQERNDKWHVNKAFVLGFLFANISYAIYGLSWLAVLFLVAQLCLVVLVFNPSINLNKGNDFDYLSKEGFEGWFRKKGWEFLYYITFLILFIFSIVTLLVLEIL